MSDVSNLKQLTVIDHPLVQHKLTHLRKKETPTVHFRQLMREISFFLTYECTREMPMEDYEIETPVGKTTGSVLAGKKLALVSILRAGNGFLDGILEMVPNARVGFVGLYRDEKTLKPVKYYFKVPEDMGNRLVLTVDPMLATGNSAIDAISELKQAGAKDIRFMCLVASPEGVKNLIAAHPDVQIVTASLDEKLNEKGYIVPGLGDAGDRMFGTK